MIQANELRINNWILIKGDEFAIKGIFTELDIEENYFCVQAGPDILDYQIRSIEPIPLTEEWLLRFGFWKSKHGWFEKTPVARFTIEKINEVFMVNSGYDADGEPNLIAILYHVHQLQNFWASCNLGEL